MPQNWTQQNLENQFNRAKNRGWLPFFQNAADNFKFTVWLLLGIASRETGIENIVGDGGHGKGVLQVDDRSFPQWCNSGAWHDVNQAIDKGAFVLASKRDELRQKHAGEFATLDDLLRVSVAAYNTGARRAFEDYKLHGNPDLRTTGHDYSADVLKRAQVFAALLATINTPHDASTASPLTLKRGDVSQAVREMQNALASLGFMEARRVDGIYSDITANAVKNFQTAENLKADGVFGGATRSALNAAIKEKG